VKGKELQSPDIRNEIQSRLNQWRRRLLWQRLIFTGVASTVLMTVALLMTTPLTTLLQQLAVLILVSFALLLLSGKWRRLNAENFMAHLNRRFPAFEESAHLLIIDGDKLTAMQTLQAQRAREAWPEALRQVEQWQPPVRYHLALFVTIVFALLAIFSDELQSLANRWLPGIYSTSVFDHQDRKTAGIGKVSVSISPPAYTGLETTQNDQLNLELAEGSDVQWVLSLDSEADSHVLENRMKSSTGWPTLPSAKPTFTGSLESRVNKKRPSVTFIH
jgi:hypothetical protein